MSDRPARDRPGREPDKTADDTPVDAASGKIGVYEQRSSRQGRSDPAAESPEPIGVYDRPPSADRRTPPAIMAIVLLVVLAVLALLAFTLLF